MSIASPGRYLNRFRLRDALRLMLFHAAQRVLSPDAKIGYAREGADRVVLALLDGKADGYYVDVGANDPIRYSNTFELYRRGWRGLAVDGSAAMVAKCAATRPLDICVHAVVSNEEREVVFTEFERSDVSSLSPEHVAHWREHTPVVAEHRLVSRTLTAICRENQVPPRFDFLSVDVERHDLEVLKSLDLEAFRPEIIAVELLDMRVNGTSDPIVKYLAGQGFSLVGMLLEVGYFRDSRPRELKAGH